MKLLECEKIAASYDGTGVIENLSFSVDEGDYLCILGENGSGKSTLVKCLLGIKQLDGGKITMVCVRPTSATFLSTST